MNLLTLQKERFNNFTTREQQRQSDVMKVMRSGLDMKTGGDGMKWQLTAENTVKIWQQQRDWLIETVVKSDWFMEWDPDGTYLYHTQVTSSSSSDWFSLLSVSGFWLVLHTPADTWHLNKWWSCELKQFYFLKAAVWIKRYWWCKRVIWPLEGDVTDCKQQSAAEQGWRWWRTVSLCFQQTSADCLPAAAGQLCSTSVNTCSQTITYMN